MAATTRVTKRLAVEKPAAAKFCVSQYLLQHCTVVYSELKINGFNRIESGFMQKKERLDYPRYKIFAATTCITKRLAVEKPTAAKFCVSQYLLQYCTVVYSELKIKRFNKI